MSGTSMFRSRDGWVQLLAALCGLVGCGGQYGEPIETVETYSIRVTTQTSGPDPDPDGYQLTVGAQTRSITPNSFERWQNLPSGDYTVTLSAIAENCSVANNPRQVTASTTGASTTFDVICVAKAGTLTVGVQTVGPTNHTGYTVTAAGQTKTLGLNGSTSFGAVAVGDYSVLLGGIPVGCFVTLLPNPRTVTVTFNQAAFTRFDVDCGGQNGTLEVTTVTTGIDPDANGYTVMVGQTPFATGINATTRLDQVTPGTYPVQLSDLASNCVTSANPRNVIITALTLTQTRFDVVCGPAARIAFKSVLGGDDEIWTMLPDGRDLRQITTNNEDDYDPDWSPDGLQIAFSHGGDIWVMNADGTNQHRVPTTPTPQFDDEPDWSPDGLRLVFESDAGDGTREIWVMDASNGGNLRQLTNGAGSSFKPHFSPNGPNSGRIVFSSNRSGNLDVFTMLDGPLTGPTQLTTSPAVDDYPAWSPTGDQIIFASNRDPDGDGELWVMNANGSNQTQRTFNTSNEWGPAWGADGTIAFATNRNGNQDIYLLFPNALELQLTNNSANEEHPDWRPTPPPAPPPPPSPASLGERAELLPAAKTPRVH